jgi:hypothetical protein
MELTLISIFGLCVFGFLTLLFGDEKKGLMLMATSLILVIVVGVFIINTPRRNWPKANECFCGGSDV